MRRPQFVNAGATDLTLSQRGRLLHRCPVRSANEDGSWELSRSVKTREQGTIVQICTIHPDVERHSLGQHPTPLRAGDWSCAPPIGSHEEGVAVTKSHCGFTPSQRPSFGTFIHQEKAVNGSSGVRALSSLHHSGSPLHLTRAERAPK